MTGERFHPIGPLVPGAPGRALRVFDRRTGMEVAVKRLPLPEGRFDFDEVRRQAMAAGGLRHPSIHPVYEVVGVGAEVWILSPIVNGWSLRAELHQRAALGPAAAAAIGLRVLDALTYAHRHGVTHGNLHPGNVLLAPGGHVVLNDFAIPALAQETTARLPGFTAPELTPDDSPPPGTTPEPVETESPEAGQRPADADASEAGPEPADAEAADPVPERARDETAPERTDGQAAGPGRVSDGVVPGPAADLWALGAILYTATLGRAPFVRATPAATAEAVRQGIAIEAKDPFTALLRDLLDPDPARRPDAATVHAVLQGAAARPAFEVATVTVGGVEIVGHPIPADAPAPPPAPPKRSPRLKPATLVPAVAAAAVLGAGLALLVPVGTTATPPAAASGTLSAAAPVPDDIPPFTKPPKPCTLVSDDLVRELAPSAGKPFTYVNGNFTSCSWKSDYAIPEAKRGELSITLDTLGSEAMSDGTFDLSKRVASRLHTNYHEVDGLAHDAFTYTDTTTNGFRRYKVTYEFRLSNLHGTVEYGRSVGVDPDGSIAGNAEKVTRLVIDRLLKRPS